jgi:hypothetical protein
MGLWFAQQAKNERSTWRLPAPTTSSHGSPSGQMFHLGGSVTVMFGVFA